MEFIKGSGTFTGKIVRAEHKNFHDKVQGVEITMNVGGRGLFFLLITTKSNGDTFFKHKEKCYTLPGFKLIMKIEDVLGVEAVENNGFYDSLEGKEITVNVRTHRHTIKRHEFYINNLTNVVESQKCMEV